jgi:predicted membrane protein
MLDVVSQFPFYVLDIYIYIYIYILLANCLSGYAWQNFKTPIPLGSFFPLFVRRDGFRGVGIGGALSLNSKKEKKN